MDSAECLQLRQDGAYLSVSKDGKPSFPLGYVRGAAVCGRRGNKEYRPIYRLALRHERLSRVKPNAKT